MPGIVPTLGRKRADTKAKSDEDCERRTADPLRIERAKTTFVVLTLRRWNDKENWAAQRTAEGKWAGVRAYDADDVEGWLERATAVGAWLARIIRNYPDGVLSIDDFWAEYSFGTEPRFTPDIVLAGRTAEARGAAEWLQHGSGILRVVADSPREALAFVAASMSQIPPEDQFGNAP